MGMGLAGPQTTYDCAGEGQQLFTRPTDSVRAVRQKIMIMDPEPSMTVLAKPATIYPIDGKSS
jgi:hypothetical protein